VRALHVALQFLTRLPLPAVQDWREDELARAIPMFPLVGAAIGLALGGCFTGLTSAGLGPLPAAILATAFLGPLLTGALHEDGLGDTADGLFGGRDRDTALRIFRDSRVGAYAVVAMVAAMMLRVAIVAELTPTAAVATLALAHALGRAASVAQMVRLPYARTEAVGVGGSMAAGVRAHHVVATVIVTAGVVAGAAVVLGPQGPIRATLAAAACAMVLTRWYRRRLQGITGDTMGATCVLVELTVLVVAPLIP
jgi:adenosylcobinamide-GDP ribazoletransferase